MKDELPGVFGPCFRKCDPEIGGLALASTGLEKSYREDDGCEQPHGADSTAGYAGAELPTPGRPPG